MFCLFLLYLERNEYTFSPNPGPNPITAPFQPVHAAKALPFRIAKSR